MGRATPHALELMSVKVMRADRAEEVGEMASAAAALAFDSLQSVAVLLSQRLIGRKQWVSK